MLRVRKQAAVALGLLRLKYRINYLGYFAFFAFFSATNAALKSAFLLDVIRVAVGRVASMSN